MSLKRHDGELTIDNRAPGTPAIPGMGAFVELATVSCRHCGGVWAINPMRIRPREYCRFCNMYICDGCAATSKKPDYVHRTIDDLTEMVTSGHYTVIGGTVCDPILLRS